MTADTVSEAVPHQARAIAQLVDHGRELVVAVVLVLVLGDWRLDAGRKDGVVPPPDRLVRNRGQVAAAVGDAAQVARCISRASSKRVQHTMCECRLG